ncbi:MAG: acetyl-CoA acetyltransferase [Acidimicrobiales bacterium]
MTTDPERIPVVIASGESIERSDLVSPIDLMERACESALAEAPQLRDGVERISVVNILSRSVPAPATALAERLGLRPRRCEVTTIGGNSPQWLVTRAASDIASGSLSSTVIAGAESMRSTRARRTTRRRSSGQRPPQGRPAGRHDEEVAPPEAPADPVVGDALPGVGPAETAIGLVLPAHIYPMFESVLAARAGHRAAEHRQALGSVLAPFTEVASRNPFAWFTDRLSAEAIATPAADNRIVSEPYTKRMNAFLGSDQGAALIVCSLAAARRAGVADRAVFIWSGAEATDVRSPVARPDPGRSPAIAAAGRALLAAASSAAARPVDIDDVGVLDLYSCFPSAVQLAAEALGIALDDSRGLTSTGGLPYFGGPGSNYTTHGIAAVTETVRRGDHLDGPGTGSGGVRLGLATGLGWFVTKHALGLYGSAPPPKGFHQGDTSGEQAVIDASAIDVALVAGVSARAEVMAATVVRDRDGIATDAPLIARLRDGRHMALGAADHDTVLAAGALDLSDLVGATVFVEASAPRYRLLPG